MMQHAQFFCLFLLCTGWINLTCLHLLQLEYQLTTLVNTSKDDELDQDDMSKIKQDFDPIVEFLKDSGPLSSLYKEEDQFFIFTLPKIENSIVKFQELYREFQNNIALKNLEQQRTLQQQMNTEAKLMQDTIQHTGINSLKQPAQEFIRFVTRFKIERLDKPKYASLTDYQQRQEFFVKKINKIYGTGASSRWFTQSDNVYTWSRDVQKKIDLATSFLAQHKEINSDDYNALFDNRRRIEGFAELRTAIQRFPDSVENVQKQLKALTSKSDTLSEKDNQAINDCAEAIDHLNTELRWYQNHTLLSEYDAEYHDLLSPINLDAYANDIREMQEAMDQLKEGLRKQGTRGIYFKAEKSWKISYLDTELERIKQLQKDKKPIAMTQTQTN